jgi:predicted phage gp36 major capsid-like protein
MLARSGTVKERLQAAYRLQLADIDSEQLPDDVRKDFESLRCALTREKPMRGEDAVAATIRKLSSREVDDLAASLIEIFATYSRTQDTAPARAGASTSQTAQVIPLFAIEARP